MLIAWHDDDDDDGDWDETNNYVISDFTKLAKKEYKTRHD